MTTYNTGNPLGSAAAKDLFDNAQNLDFALNDITKAIWNDRFGRSRKSWFGIQKEAQAAIAAFGYITIDSFQAGATLTLPNQILRDTDTGEYYRWDGGFPVGGKVVPADSTPSSSGGIGLGAWVSVGDASLRSDLSSSKYRFIAGSENLESPPDKYSYGPGKVTIGEVVFEGFIPGMDILKSSMFMTPEDAIYGAGLGFPADSNSNFNFVMSIGAHPENATLFNRTTSYGTNNFVKPIQSDRNEAFGNSALMFMRYGERNTFFGSISGQYLGTTDPSGDGHNWFGTEESGGYYPGDASWDWQGLEAANPGIGAKIAAETTFSTTPDDSSRNVGVGRDAMNLSVKNRNCTALGYRALCNSYVINNSVAVGADALMNGVFHGNSVAVGYAAATNWQEGYHNTVIGSQAGSGAITGQRNTLIGAYAGSDAKELDDCIFIGRTAGNKVIAAVPNPQNILVIGNDLSGISSPLICGDMLNKKLGVNILPTKISGTFHVRSGDAADSVISPRAAADDLIIENSTNTGLTIRSGAGGTGNIDFSSPTVPNVATIFYDHTAQDMTFRVASVERWKINAASLNPASDNVFSLGSATRRASVVYAGTGTINTSDGRLKEDVVEIDEAERRVAIAVKSLIRRFKYKDSVETKGADARLHFGVVAQDVKAAFEAEGLIAEDYGVLCYDEWEDEYALTEEEAIEHPVQYSKEPDANGNLVVEKDSWIEVTKPSERVLVTPAGNRYGIRYEELLCFIIAAM